MPSVQCLIVQVGYLLPPPSGILPFGWLRSWAESGSRSFTLSLCVFLFLLSIFEVRGFSRKGLLVGE